MATLEDIIRQLAAIQLRQGEQQQPRPQSIAEAVKISKDSIIKFDRINTNNFVDSVETSLALALS